MYLKKLQFLKWMWFTKVYIDPPSHHGDPFDRMLIAQAMNHSLIVVSRDSAFDAYPIQQLWD